MSEIPIEKNAVLGDDELQVGLRSVNAKWGEFVIRSAGEVWGMPLIDQKTKAFITIAIDIVNCDLDSGSAFSTHINMARKQGATFEEIEELLLFLCVYTGFNKIAPAFNKLNEIQSKE